ncbi:MAG TPA: signal peptidase II [Patescibacteria group bacterium]|nr:signal peptidase II [Patescibacteria group bacterium]
MLCGVFLLGDQFLKWQALHGWQVPKVWRGVVGWQPFLNPGVAFGIPIPNFLVLLFTVPIIAILIFLLQQQLSRLAPPSGTKAGTFTALLLVLTGAVSNLIDRFTFAHTIDYILVFTAVINLADVLIVVGFVVYLISLRNERQEVKKTKKQENN